MPTVSVRKTRSTIRDMALFRSPGSRMLIISLSPFSTFLKRSAYSGYLNFIASSSLTPREREEMKLVKEREVEVNSGE